MLRGRRWTWFLVVVLGLGVALGAACGDDDSSSAPTSEASSALPADLDEVREVFGEALAEEGFVITERGGLVDELRYQPDPEGTHLALYLEPTRARTDQEYVDGILETARLLTPAVFERWPGLESYDVCQEVEGGGDEEAALTQFATTREESDAVDWDTITLAEMMVRASERASEGFRLLVRLPLRESAAFQDALRAAGLPTADEV